MLIYSVHFVMQENAMSLFETIDKGAHFSPCRLYRYQLWRIWDTSTLPLNVIGLNPSTADEAMDDPTIRRCIQFAKRWGYGGLLMTNLFAFRATDPKVMKQAVEPVGAENDQWLKESAAGAGLILAAWGNHGTHLGRDRTVQKIISGAMCFRLTKQGQPEHPLYQRADAKLVEYC